jgi:hypothetical protein
VHSGTDPPGETTLDPWLDDPFPHYDTEPVSHLDSTRHTTYGMYFTPESAAVAIQHELPPTIRPELG